MMGQWRTDNGPTSVAVAAALVPPGLPPGVEGERQGHVYVELPFLDLPSLPPNRDIAVVGCVEWWGLEPGRPQPLLAPHGSEASLAAGGTKRLAFPVRCSPEKFASYLRDMRILPIRLQVGGASFGRAEVDVTPWLRGEDAGFSLRLDGTFPVGDFDGFDGGLGSMRLRLWTDWTPQARLRLSPAVKVLSSFERNELWAQLDGALPLRPAAPLVVLPRPATASWPVSRPMAAEAAAPTPAPAWGRVAGGGAANPWEEPAGGFGFGGGGLAEASRPAAAEPPAPVATAAPRGFGGITGAGAGAAWADGAEDAAKLCEAVEDGVHMYHNLATGSYHSPPTSTLLDWMDGEEDLSYIGMRNNSSPASLLSMVSHLVRPSREPSLVKPAADSVATFKAEGSSKVENTRSWCPLSTSDSTFGSGYFGCRWLCRTCCSKSFAEKESLHEVRVQHGGG
mmetsp:Transcript_168874/g.542809  ORF Transcript_168874/g.542809 Transcript_168874/m.542809 type:complete len:451 (-) Transcript_168874:168-1520(-)